MGFFDIFKSKKEQKSVVTRTPLNLQVGDIVEYDLIEYQVIGKIIYNEGGYRWYDYHLSDGKEHVWLFAEQDDQLEVALFKKLDPGHQLYARLQEELPTNLNYNGNNFSLLEEGIAKIIVEGQVGAKTDQRVKYWDYKASNGNQISVEKWGNQLEVSLGEQVKPSLLKYYPGE